jgi:hypothetical protein
VTLLRGSKARVEETREQQARLYPTVLLCTS